MDVRKLFVAICLFLFSIPGETTNRVAEATKAQNLIRDRGLYNRRPAKLFVFGDSYADTGNNRKTQATSWKVPYGITFPGKPSRRFSDGRVLTDYLARFLGLKSPVAYRWRKYGGNRLRYGMNFAYGGTGVFDTPVPYPKMSTQIGFFQDLINNESLYTRRDLKSSLVLVTLSGNDYDAYLSRGGATQELPSFIAHVVNQLAVDLSRIGGTGVGKVAVASLQPLGCLPQSTIRNSFQQCNTTDNTAVNLHNHLLQQAVTKLNNETEGSPFVILDLFNSFLTVLENKENIGSVNFETPLKPCCMGINSNFSCGYVDENGDKMYTICSDPNAAFFWDMVHPSQAGWRAVYLALKSTLQRLIF